MKAIFLALGLIFSVSSLQAAEFQLQNWTGALTVHHGNKVVKPKIRAKLTVGAELKTPKDSYARLELAGGGVVVVQPESQVVVSKEGLMVHEGQVRFEDAPQIKMSTPISEHRVEKGTALLSYFPLYGKSQLKVIKGKVISARMGFAEEVSTQAGQELVAQALVDEEGPIFDVFLGGKSRVRGNFEKVSTFSDAEALLKNSVLTKRMPPPPKPKGPVAKAGEICNKPFAKYNTCLWTCIGAQVGDTYCNLERQGVYCQRKRCNANGEWEENSRLPASQGHFCQGTKPVLAACDY